MTTSIQDVREATDEEWDRIWKQCTYATYFHSREWSLIWNKHSNGKIVPSPHIIRFSDGKLALVPLSIKKGFLKTCLSSPAGTFGGWISTDNLEIEHTALLTNYLLRRNSAVHWRLNPYYPMYDAIKVLHCREDVTHSLDLRRGLNHIFKGWTKGHRSAAAKAKREGVTSRLANSEADWKEYYLMYEDSLLRWGANASSRYSWRLFDIIRNAKSHNIKLWLADFKGRSIAGALCFYASTHVVYWHGAALAEHFSLRPVHLLMCDIIKNATEAGYWWFDFNPSGGHEGVRKFKEGFGAQSLRCDLVHCNTVRTYLYAQITKNFIRAGKALRILNSWLKGIAPKLTR